MKAQGKKECDCSACELKRNLVCQKPKESPEWEIESILDEHHFKECREEVIFQFKTLINKELSKQRAEMREKLDWYVVNKHDCDKKECKVIDYIYHILKDLAGKERKQNGNRNK